MALFRCASGSSGGGATITVTYSSDFYGETVTCSHGTKTYSKVATSSGTLEFSVDEEGTWTISCTIGSDTFSTTADVDLTYDAELVSLPNGETVLPTDDIETWLACAAITDKAYTTLSQVLGDSETYNALLGDSNACAYMKRSTTWSTDICASQYAMNLLGQYDTACDALLSDSTWASAIANSTYFESVLNVKVPVMTSDSAPEGLAFGGPGINAPYSTYHFDPYLSFNGNSSDGCHTKDASNSVGWIGYKFISAVIVNKVYAKWAAATRCPSTLVVQGSNDSTTGADGTWTDIYTTTSITAEADNTWAFDNDTAYKWYRIYGTGMPAASGWYGIYVFELQFYGRTTSSEKIHGGNPTYDSFYRIVDGNNVPVTDPSLLDAGTYTIYSNGLAKATDLTSDYGKTVRICPNTKEIVIRPDNSLYWYGVMLNGCEEMSAANGWTGATFNSPTFNAQNVYAQAGGSGIGGGIGSKYPMTMTALHAIGLGTQVSGHGAYIGYYASKAPESATENTMSTTQEHKVVTASGSYYVFGYSNTGSTVRSITLDALWTE